MTKRIRTLLFIAAAIVMLAAFGLNLYSGYAETHHELHVPSYLRFVIASLYAVNIVIYLIVLPGVIKDARRP